MHLPDLDVALKQHDHQQWLTLMSPTPSGYVPTLGIIPLFSWVLNRGYEKSDNDVIKQLGETSFKRATKAKLLLLVGLALIVIGFGAVLAGF